MILSLVKKDFKRNKSINITLISFIVLSAFLMSIATMIIIQLFSSIDSMYEVAKPPHFMQMHVGDVDQYEIDEFANSIDYVEDWQTIEMVNIYGGNIWISKPDGTSYSMSDSLLDIGWVKQNPNFDLLLDTKNNPINPSKGEIGVPIIILDKYDINLGDIITIKDNEFSMKFTVTSYVRDSQMNSTMTSSTRFLINEDDHDRLKANMGELEYLIEFYLSDTSLASEFQSEYEKAGMPINGQGITYTIIRLVSGLSDMLMAILLVLVSFALIFVVFLCLRFTILTVMEEEIKSIGTMRAIGMTYRNIRQIYLVKYRIIALIGCVIGYLLSIISINFFTSHITKTFGAPEMSFASISIPIIAVFIVYLLEVHFSKRILKKIKNITVVGALVTGISISSTKVSRLTNKISLDKFKDKSANIYLSTKQLVVKFKTWFVLLFIMMIASAIMLVPMNLYNTMKSPEFITYMGQSQGDILVNISTSENLTDKYNNIIELLNKDDDISNYKVEAKLVYEAINKDEEWINLHVDSSSDVNSELQYIEGSQPINNNEIAISLMNSRELGVGVNDSLKMNIDGKVVDITVTGIYQDVTSGGYTSKMNITYKEESVREYSILINLNDDVNIESKVEKYQKDFGIDTEVTDMDEFIDQTLGGVTDRLSVSVYAVAILTICLVALITVLFLKLQTVKEYSQIAILKAIGFSTKDIRKQYLLKVSFVSLLGIVLGTIIANSFGEVVVSGFFSIVGLGISKISFIINPFVAYLVFPLTIILIVVLVTWYSTQGFKKYNIINLINE